MYMICYVHPYRTDTWEIVSGEDAMNLRAEVLMMELGISEEEIMVFDMDDEIKINLLD